MSRLKWAALGAAVAVGLFALVVWAAAIEEPEPTGWEGVERALLDYRRQQPGG